jgi:hypothetical protein
LYSGQTYYLVYYPSAPDEALYLMGESYDASGNTLYLSDGAWQQENSFDLLVRPVVSSLTGVEELPVELVAFGSQVEGRDVRLRWQTASETNNARFEVQRRKGEGSWTTVGQVQGSGTTNRPQDYSHRLSDLSYGSHQFRLRQIDIDGTVHHSREVKAVISPSQGLTVQAYPNPVTTKSTVKVATGRKQDVTVEVYDLLGRRVMQLLDETVSPEQPVNLTLEGGALSSGTYFLRVRGEGVTKTERITVVR